MMPATGPYSINSVSDESTDLRFFSCSNCLILRQTFSMVRINTITDRMVPVITKAKRTGLNIIGSSTESLVIKSQAVPKREPPMRKKITGIFRRILKISKQHATKILFHFNIKNQIFNELFPKYTIECGIILVGFVSGF